MFDGVFTKYLINELKQIENVRINKLKAITDSEFYLSLSQKNKLLISVNSNNMNVRLTSMEISNNQKMSNFQQLLKKYLESSIINHISQFENDRIIIFDITSYDELGYLIPLKLIIELFGRNSNIILCNSTNNSSPLIIDAYKRCLDETHDSRIILPKYSYSFPKNEQINPYTLNNQGFNSIDNCYQGISTLLYNQLQFDNSFKRIFSEVKPVIIKTSESKKNIFYCFDLPMIDGERIYFSSLSELLDYYFINLKKDESQSFEQIYLQNYIKHQIDKINSKISKQQNELLIANENLICEKIGNLLSCNLHLIHKGDKEITVTDYYDCNKPFVINLNPLLYPNENLEHIFNKYHKAKRAIIQIKKQIELSENELKYLECLLIQVNISRLNDVIEIYNELNIKNKVKDKVRNSKPNYTAYKTLNDDLIWVGKNNLQNNYLTNIMAKNTDYFFHVQGVPGSHVIVRTTNLTDELINLASVIASYYSSYRYATNVCVDYTLVKNVKKIPGIKGSFVTYNKYQSCFAKPDLAYIKSQTK